MKPIFVHVHIYYADMWSELKEYLCNISVPYDLHVTTVFENSYLQEDVLYFDSNAHFEIVENRGYDVGPFIYVLSKINLDSYSYVIKIHTKRDMAIQSNVNGFLCEGAKWREYCLSFLQKENFDKCIKAFDSRKKLGMIGNYHLISKKEEYDKEAKKDAIQMIKAEKNFFHGYKFIAGTMFFCRSHLLKKLQNLNLKITDFEFADRQHTSSKAHVIERYLGLSILSQGYKIEDVFTDKKEIFKSFMHFLYVDILNFLYRKKITSKGVLIIKIFKIPVFRIKIKNKTN